MPITYFLIDNVAGSKWLSFMDGYSGYNQIYMAEEDIHKIAFQCPRSLGIYECVMMPFGLKNTKATCQRAMNAIFHDLIGKFMVYIDDIFVKSRTYQDYLEDLAQAFRRDAQAWVEIEPTQVCFWSFGKKLLGFFGTQQGIKTDDNKVKVILAT